MEGSGKGQRSKGLNRFDIETGDVYPRNVTIGGATNLRLSAPEGDAYSERRAYIGPANFNAIQSVIGNADLNQNYSLQSAILASMLEAAGQEPKCFLPLDKLNALITLSSIKAELQRERYKLDEDEQVLTSIAQQVLEVQNVQDKGPRKKGSSRRRIFGVLVMLQRADAIRQMIAEGLYDSDLPFQFMNLGVFRRADDCTQSFSIRFFRDWNFVARGMFEMYQFQMAAPHFVLSWHPGYPVYHYRIPSSNVLPFISDQSMGATKLGYSRLSKVAIHNAHFEYLPKQVRVSSVLSNKRQS